MKKSKEPKIWEGTVLTIPNRHYDICGKPPNLVASGHYTAYFENDYGEQLVFTYDWKEHKGTLWHGDCTWYEPIEVFDGVTPGIILSEEEAVWLHHVWNVATRREPEIVKVRSALTLAQAQVGVYDELIRTLHGAEMERHFEREKKRWQTKEQSLQKRLSELKAVEEAEDILKGGKGDGNEPNG